MSNIWGPTNNLDISPPADARRYLGSAFRHQSMTGVMVQDPADDRVDFVAGEDGRPVEQISPKLGADVPSVGMEAADFGTGVTGTTFPRQYGEEPFPHNPDPSLIDMVQGTAAIVPNQKSWYDTLRPYAGFPLPGTNDTEYALLTDETEPVVRAEYPSNLTFTDRTLLLPDRRVKDIPDKMARNPASPNDERPWDIIMGAWPWTGDKSVMQQPVASMPRFYATGLPDGFVQSPAGSGPTVPNTVDLYPYPLTWRLSASPFDTGQAGYMDAGTAASSG